MDTIELYKLIDGTFTPADAKTVLFSLVESKIRYHWMEKFSNLERFGKDINHSEKRVEELVKLYGDLKVTLEKAAENNKNVKLRGTIELIFVDH